MAQRDIDIRIRARDDASRHAKKIADALKGIGTDAQEATKGIGAAGTALGGLAADVNKLQQDTGRLTALGKLSDQFDKAAISAERARKAVGSSAREFSELRNEHDRAGRSADALKQKVDAETAALHRNRDALRDARKEQVLANREAKKAETLAGRLTEVRPVKTRRGVGIEAGAPQSSARDSMAAFLAPEINAARAAQAQAATSVEKYAAAAREAKGALDQLTPEVAEAAREQRQLATEVERAGNALLAARADAAKTEAKFDEIGTAAYEASAAMGNVALSQDAIARAADRNAASLKRVGAAMAAYQKFSTGGGDFADPKTAAALRAQNAAIEAARGDLAALRAEAARLAVEMKSTSGNVTQQVDAFNKMSNAVRAAEAEMNRQIVTMNRMRGVTQSSFGAWARATIPLQQAAVASRNMSNASQRAAQAQNQLRPALAGTGTAAGLAGRQVTLMSKSILGLGHDTRQTLSYMQRMRGEILALSASFVGFYAAIEQGRGALEAFRTVEALQSRLGAVFAQDTQRVSAEISWLRSESDRLALSVATMAQQYGKFAVAADASNISLGATREIFTSLAEAGRVNKLTTDQMSGAFLALEQIISKGKFTAEEVRGQLGERLPGAFTILADAMGVTTAQLDKMMEAGEVLASEENLLKFADELTKRFGPQLSASLDSVSADLGRFENDVFNARLALAQGFIPQLRSALQAFNAFANSAEGAKTFAAIGEGAGQLVGVLAKIPAYFDEIKLVIQGFVAIKVAGVFASLASNVLTATRGFGLMGKQILVTSAQMRQMNAVERSLAVGFNQTVGTLSRKRAALLSTATATGTLTARNQVLIASMTAVRGVAVVLGTTLRAVYAAFGGLPGLIATGISVALVGWAGSTDKINASLTAHNRILDRVKEGYNQAGDSADNWAKKIQNVTLAQAIAGAEELKRSYASITKSIEAAGRQARASFNDVAKINPLDPRALQTVQIETLTKQLSAGSITIKAFSEAMNDIATNAADDQLKSIALEILDLVNSSEDGTSSLIDLSNAVQRAEAATRVMSGTATDADKKLLGIGQTIVETTKKVVAAVDPMDRYRTAMTELKALVPSLSDEMDRLKNVTELTGKAWTAFTAAVQAGKVSEALDAVRMGLQGLGDLGFAQQTAMMDSYIGGGTRDDYVRRMRYAEGGEDGGGPNTSSARGIGQFTSGTWIAYLDRLFPELKELNNTQKLALRTSEKHASAIIDSFTNDNAAALSRQGIEANSAANLYLAHFLGAGDAVKVLLANPDELASNIVAAGSVKANPTVFRDGMTARDLINWSSRKMGGGNAITSSGATQPEMDRQESYKAQSEAQMAAFKLSQEQSKATKERLADLDHEISQQKLINAEKGKEAAIETALREARAENPSIGAAEIAQITAKTAALYEQQHARDALNLAEEKVNQLYELRQQLLEQQDMARDSGDMETFTALKQQITDINAQLLSAIPQAITMWQAIGGTEADAAIAKLNTMGMSLKNNKDRMVALGLNAQQFGQLVGSGVEGLVSVLDAFAQAVANGSNAFKAAGTAFLQFAADFLREIAVMIARQTILNFLASMSGMGGFGGSIGTAATSLGGISGHTGGMVGSAAIGGGNRIGSFGQSYRHALVMHNGGRVGLKTNEVNATLKVGEEVLTDQDPRHQSNRGGESGTAARDRGIKQVLAIGDGEIANAMSGTAGERVIMTMLQRNKATLRTMLG